MKDPKRLKTFFLIQSSNREATKINPFEAQSATGHSFPFPRVSLVSSFHFLSGSSPLVESLRLIRIYNVLHASRHVLNGSLTEANRCLIDLPWEDLSIGPMPLKYLQQQKLLITIRILKQTVVYFLSRHGFLIKRGSEISVKLSKGHSNWYLTSF